jgi:hypothetical protein
MTEQDPAIAATRKRSVPIPAIVAAVLAVALIGMGAAWYFSARAAADRLAETENRLDALEASITPPAEEPALNEPTEDVEDAPVVPAGPPETTASSYVSYAYVTSVSASAGTYNLALDLFQIYSGTEATKYANDHGLAVPSNGILYVNEDPGVIGVPLANTAVIRYATGGVEALSMVAANAEQLREWADGDWDALPGAMTDMWKVTVENGVATRVEMVAIAD